MREPVIEAIDVVRRYGRGAAEVQALRGVNLKIRAGELTLLMGPSGSGKTTLLSILGCMLSPSSGTVRLRGETTTNASQSELARLRRQHVGFIFQSYHLFPTLSALDNVRLALDVRGQTGQAAVTRALDVLAAVGLAHKKDAFPHEMSGGEQQRVAIARAIAGTPSIILADEPTGALDTENGYAVMKVLARIARDPGHGVLVVTHDPRVRSFANRILYIEDGRIVGEERGTGLAAAE
ncbi:MAG TPA: ABC transporter ATP-binding protein [Rhizomicrobium sp.]|nr:ABC transporter ATP-binding protein [Rhizomicrobium sp.]